MISRMFQARAAPLAIKLATAGLMLVMTPAFAGVGQTPCQQPMRNALQNGNAISIEECSVALFDTGAHSPAIVAAGTTFYNVYNDSSIALYGFAVSTTAASPTVFTQRANWSAMYVSQSDWDSPQGPSADFGSFASLFGNTDTGAAFYFLPGAGAPIGAFSHVYQEFFIQGAPDSNFIAMTSDGGGGLTIVAQSLTPVPEVPALWLMGVGLAGLAAVRRRARRR